MSLLHDAYTALLSGLTYKTGNEIHWYDEGGNPITVEPIDVEIGSYIIRYYNEDGNLCREEDCSQYQLHGKSVSWYKNGQKFVEVDYHQGRLHGKSIGWYGNGQIRWETDYINNRLHGKRIEWHEDGVVWLYQGPQK